MSSDLLSLPPEVLSIVAETLDKTDVKQLRLSCKQLGSFLEDAVLHTVSFNINAPNLFSESGIPKLQYLATKRHSGPSRATKHLIIGCLSPEYDPNYEAESYVNGEWVVTVPPKDQPKGIAGRKQMKLYLFYALKSLKNVRSVSWKISQNDEEWAQRTVMKALESLRSLRSARIEIDWARIPLPLHRLRNLQDITIVDSKPSKDSGNAYQTYLNLGKMISRSPHLVGIDIQRGDYDSTHADISASLHQLFWCYPASRAPLRLKHLVISKMFVKLDQRTLPHFHHLKLLDLSNMLEPFHMPSVDAQYDYDTSFSPSCTQLHASQKLVGSNIDDIWLALAGLGVELEVIKVRKVTAGLLNYLETYYGVKKLHMLSSSSPAIPAESDELASQFFGTSLGRHVQTIETLDIEAANEGLWCFGAHNMSVIASCTNLSSLGIPVSSLLLKPSTCDAEPEPGSEPTSQIDKFDSITSLYDTISCQLIKLHTLKVSIPGNIDRFEGYWCGYSVSQHFSWVCDTVAERLCIYSTDKPGSLSGGLPVVVIGEKSCKEKKLEPFQTTHPTSTVGVREDAEARASTRGRFSYREVC